MADIAHICGLVAAEAHPTPVPYAEVVTSTTHKTLRGPRGAMILCKQEYAEQIDRAVFPGIQAGPLMQIVAAKAVCFKEAGEFGFREYQRQIIRNCQARNRASRWLPVGPTITCCWLTCATKISPVGRLRICWRQPG